MVTEDGASMTGTLYNSASTAVHKSGFAGGTPNVNIS